MLTYKSEGVATLRTWKPKTAGIMTIVSGCYGIGLGAVSIQGPSFLNQFLSDIWIGDVPSDIVGHTASEASEMAAYGILFIVFGVIALIGGIFALPPEWRYPQTRRIWGLALAGAILSLWMIPIGTVLGILSVVFLFKSKGEFV